MATTCIAPEAVEMRSRPTPRIRVLVADDHAMVRQGLRTVLETEAGFQVCGEAFDGREAVAMAVRLKPDVAVLDISMPALNGLEAARQIRKLCERTEILVLTVHDSEELAQALLSAGVYGYLLKSDVARDLVTGIDSVYRHRPFFTTQVAKMVLDGFLRSAGETGGDGFATPSGLTHRERETLQLLAEGKSSKEVASLLGLSLKTAETHRANLMRKLDLHSVSDLVHYAVRNQMIEP